THHTSIPVRRRPCLSPCRRMMVFILPQGANMSGATKMEPLTPSPTPSKHGGDGKQSFAETAMRMGGKSDEEARRLGAVDKADEQVESLFAPQYQTSHSPVHRAVWDGKTPLELFLPPPLPESAPCDD